MADLIRFPDLNPRDAAVAQAVFEFVQFLLDDDANLTPTGNLTGVARQKLRTRVQETLGEEDAVGPEEGDPTALLGLDNLPEVP